jgi:hypothetical protein
MEELHQIRQGPNEPYQDFVSRSLQAVKRLVIEGKTEMILVKQLAFENTNATCQTAVRPCRKKGTLADYVQLCIDIVAFYLQGVAMVTAVRKIMPPQLWKTINQSYKRSQENCFNCGKPGHLAKQGPQKSGGTSKPPSEAGGQMPASSCTLSEMPERMALGKSMSLSVYC